MVMDSVVEHLVNPEEVLAGLRKFLVRRRLFRRPDAEHGFGSFCLSRQALDRDAGSARSHLPVHGELAPAFAGARRIFRSHHREHSRRAVSSLAVLSNRIASGDVKGAIWRAHQEIGGWYGRLIGQGPMLYAVARRGH